MFDERALARKEFEGAYTHDWGRDPFSRAVLSAPVDDTLFFAGEATSTDNQGGTVNGALETGERAATEAAASLGIRACSQ